MNRRKYEFKNILGFLLVIVSVLLFDSCHVEKTLNGVWKQRGYGRVLEINGSDFAYYTVSQRYCKQLTSGNLYEHFHIIKADQEELTLNYGSTKNYYFNRIDHLPLKCSSKEDDKDNDPERNFNVLWNIYNENYAFFGKRGVDWEKVREQYLPKVQSIKSESELYAIVKDILDSLDDGHVQLRAPDSLRISTNENREMNFERVKTEIPDAILNKYIDEFESYNDKSIAWGTLNNTNTGYIIVPSMYGFRNYGLPDEEFRDKLNQVFAADPGPGIEHFQQEVAGVDYVMKKIYADLSEADSIILDLRFNEGGFNSVAMQILSHFIRKPYKSFSTLVKEDGKAPLVQDYIIKPAKSNVFDKKVCLLTSHWTASAAEALVLSTLSDDRFKRYGDTTSGIFSEMVWAVLPNDWDFSMSIDIVSGPNGKEYEVVGIPVDYSMDYSDNVREFYRSFYKNGQFSDPLIEKFLQ